MGLSVRRFSRTVLASASPAALFLALGASASAGTLDQQQTTSNVDQGLFTNESGAQTFTAGSSGVVDQADLDLLKVGTPPPTVIVEIRTTSAGVPTATVLASGTIPTSAISLSADFVPVAFAPAAPVTAGSQYALVAYSAGSIGDAVGWRFQSAGDPYPGGDWFIDNADPLPPGANWLEDDGDDDFAFKTYVGPAPPAPPVSTGKPVKKKCKKKKHKRSAESAKKKRCKKKRR